MDFCQRPGLRCDLHCWTDGDSQRGVRGNQLFHLVLGGLGPPVLARGAKSWILQFFLLDLPRRGWVLHRAEFRFEGFCPILLWVQMGLEKEVTAGQEQAWPLPRRKP